jgi:hypothetical protein
MTANGFDPEGTVRQYREAIARRDDQTAERLRLDRP